MKRAILLWLPFGLGLALFGMFYAGLQNPGDHIIPSNLVGQPLPAFETPPALAGRSGARSSDFGGGRPRLLNVFASWCVPCVQEMRVLRSMQASGAEVTGIAIHDRPEDVAAFLARNGDPYSGIGLDAEGRTQIAFGSTGVPETFVISGDGRVLHQHIGPIGEADVPVLLSILEEKQ